ncbi:MAG: hypothetical protein Q8880_07095 [Bacteroidota bacterium]|nr:hypothetical protein [Bacteroidota bacterium]
METNYRQLILGKHSEFGIVSIANNCLALEYIFFHGAMIASYPIKKSIRYKLIYFFIGAFVINLINIIRITGLALTLIYIPSWLSINHHIIFNLVVCAVIFLMWIKWFVKN